MALKATTYDNIKSYSRSFKQMLASNPGLPFSINETPLVIKISKLANLARLYTHSGCEEIAAVLGLEGDKLTVSLLCLDSHGNVLPEHKLPAGSGGFDGEETWPDDQLIKFPQDADYATFFS
jgi:hypothetical protein